MANQTRYSKDHPVVAFFALLFFSVFLDFYMSAIPSAKKLSQYIEVIKTLNAFLPEGQKYYVLAMRYLEDAINTSQALGVKDPLAFILKGGDRKVLFLSWASKYVITFGAVYGFLHKVGFFWTFVPFILGGLFIVMNSLRFLPYLMWLKAFWLAPIKDLQVIRLILLHLANPVPASITHHNPREGGLLDHSLRVARIALQLGSPLDKKALVLAALLHDIGKIRLYRKEKIQKGSAPSPIVVKPEKKKPVERWISLEVNQKVVNMVTIREISKRFGINIPQEVWPVIAEADRKVVKEELLQGLYNVGKYIKEVLAELEYIKPKKDGWRVGDYVFVLAHAFNRRLTLKLLSDDPTLPLDPEPTAVGVHMVAYSLVADKSVPLVWEYKGKKADGLGLFDVKVRGTLFKAVYCFDLTKINLDIPQMIREDELEVIERRDQPEGEEADNSEDAQGSGVSALASSDEGIGEGGKSFQGEGGA
jgi:putative nucleotidyltransferase with HDIG domain